MTLSETVRASGADTTARNDDAALPGAARDAAAGSGAAGAQATGAETAGVDAAGAEAGAAVAASAPGKLYILGEYAVVEPGRRAVLIAVDRTVRVEAVPREDDGYLRAQGDRPALRWRHGEPPAGAESPGTDAAPAAETAPDAHAEPPAGTAPGGVVDLRFDEDPEDFYRYARAALHVVERWRAESGLPARHYALHFSSDLDDARTGAKYGLGSSGAVTVAAVGAISALYGLRPTPEQTYRLAMLATLRVTRSTSGGDLAASALGGWVSYASPDRESLARAAETETVTEMLRRPWPGLILERIDAAALPLQVRVGWTGEPADTPSLVGKVRRTARIPDALLERSDALVRDFVTLLRTGNDAAAAAPAGTAPDAGTGAGGVVPEVDVALARIVPAARALLAELAELRGTVIETPELTALCEAARAAGWNGKSSGAGGGDCGIALAAAGRDPEELSAAWRREGIRPLDLAVAPAGLRLHQPAQAHQPAPAPDHPNHQPTDPEGSTS